ncbi:nucleotide pyrophosphohydrolase [Streptomyces sp. HK10]|uniref:nucleotide pyrophosphohydrolase n=1 Tax=Streptomyces sp. HK10 TaxID=3373255 RepID=UPI003748D05A
MNDGQVHGSGGDGGGAEGGRETGHHPVPYGRPEGRAGELQRRLAEFAAARRWESYHTPKNLVTALGVEAAELAEIFQWLTPEESARVMEDPGTAGRVADETADVLAYLLQLCEVLGIDLLAALEAKIERNERRFPVAESDGGAGRGAGETDGSGGARGEANRHSSE